MSAVRAKFMVSSKTEALYSTNPPVKMVTVKMSPVGPTSRKNPTTGSWEQVQNENSLFWNASPSGSLELGCINLVAADRFELGKEYYLDFTPAPTDPTSA